MEKYAYLIMAHDHFAQLGNMLSCLGNERVDIFLHIDKKSKLEERKLKEYVFKSKLYFTKRISVSWGGYSQIKAEIILLEEATSGEHYVHFHLLTGLDFPLKKQTDILDFYDDQKEKNFISFEIIGTIDAVCFSDRPIYFYPSIIYDGKGIKGKNPKTTFIAYGTETRKSRLANDDEKLLA